MGSREVGVDVDNHGIRGCKGKQLSCSPDPPFQPQTLDPGQEKLHRGSCHTNARVTQWFHPLQDFHFVVHHRAGAANANADSLSRIWAAITGLSGVSTHPPPIFPLRSHIINMYNIIYYQASSASPWKKARNTCPSSTQADRSQLQLITRRLHKPRKPCHKGDTSP